MFESKRALWEKEKTDMVVVVVLVHGAGQSSRVRAQAKTLFKKLCASPGQYGASAAGQSRMSYEAGPMVFHYIVEHGVCI